MASMRRKSAAVALAVVGIAGLSLAAAATLNVDSNTLQAGADVFANCQPDDEPITVSYTTAYSAGEYNVTGVALAGVNAACDGMDVAVTITGASNAALAEVTGEAGTGTTSTLSAVTGTVQADAVLGAAVVING